MLAHEGPPDRPFEHCLRGDSEHIPLGLLSLAAQASAAGHDVRVLNLFAFAWQDIEAHYRGDCGRPVRFELLYPEPPRHHDAGGVYQAAAPGGAHNGGRPACLGPAHELLAHCSAIDTVVIGEGEQTFMELISRLKAG